MTRPWWRAAWAGGRLLCCGAAAAVLASCGADARRNAAPLAGVPAIVPDYWNTTVPPNCAPLNFAVLSGAQKARVEVAGRAGGPLCVRSASSSVRFPARTWKKLLTENAGGELTFSVSLFDKQRGWRRAPPATVRVAAETADSHIAYRVIKPLYSQWRDISLYQRNIGNFDEREIAAGRTFGNGCVNCHTFLNGGPDRFLLSTRSREFKSGVIFVDGEKVKRIGAKFGYASWHPGGKMVAFADMKVHQFFHTARPEIRDVIDMASCIAVFDVEQEKMRRIPDLIGANSLETYPSWAPDGKTLYFCSAKRPWGDSAQVPPPGYDRVRYSLCRISFDGKTRSWHSPEVVLSAEQTGRSMVLPRISPDGRLLLFCMCDYGVFPVFQKSSDLYCLNLATGEYRPIEGNSGESESWHSWSSNGRWIAFSSKRDDGVFTRIYLAHIDENGTVSKPFVLPQKDPLLYESQCITYSVPEFITGPIRAGGFAIGAAARQGTVAAVDAVTSSTPR